MNPLQRPNFGQAAQVGTLYDARSDAFLTLSLFAAGSSQSQSQPHSSSNSLPETSVCANYASSYEERLTFMGVGPEFGASILAGLANPVGSGSYLREVQRTHDILQADIQHTFIVEREKLDFVNGPVRDLINPDAFQSPNATHLVIGVDWGAQSIITIRHWLNPDTSTLRDEEFRAEVEMISQAINNTPRDIPTHRNDQLVFSAYGDSLCKDGIVFTDLAEAINFLDLIPVQVGQKNCAKGWPVSYTMLPVSTLALILGIHINSEEPLQPFVSIDSQHLHDMFDFFQGFDTYALQLQSYRSSIHGRARWLPNDHLEEVQHHIDAFSHRRKIQERQFGKLLLKIRGGEKTPLVLREFRNHLIADSKPPTWFEEIATGLPGKLDFISEAVTKGAKYIGHNGLNLNGVISRRIRQETFVLLFNLATFRSCEL